MEFSRKQISTILEALKVSPRGMNVSEVSRATGMNRSTVSKYLEMLYVSGQADRRTFGTSKLYYVSQRMPISAFLNFSSDLIIFLDKYSRVLNANDSFFDFTGIAREDIVHKCFDNFAFPLKFNPSIMPYIKEAIDGREASIESYYPKKDSGRYFNIKLIPLLFDDGEKGATIIFEDITEKKLAEKALLNANFELEKKVKERTKELEKANEALRRSEVSLLEAQKIARLGSWSVNLKTKEVRVSEEAYHIFGFERSTRLDIDFFKPLIHPDDIPLLEKMSEKVIAGGRPVSYEHRIVMPDGTERMVNHVEALRRDTSGEAVEVYGTIQDITERKQMEKALESERLQLLSVFDSIDQPIYVADTSTYEILFANRTMESRFGKKLAGMTCYNTIQGKDAPCEFCTNPLILKDKDRPYYWEFHNSLVNKDFMITDRIIKWPDGRDVRFEIATDITDRKRMEEALLESEERYRIITEKSYDVVFSVKPDGTISYVSPQIAYYGYDPVKLYGRNFFGFIPTSYRKFLAEKFRDTTLNGETPPTEFKFLGQDGTEYWAEVTARMIYDDAGKPLFQVGTVRDIGERKLAEEALRNSEIKFKTLFEGSSTAIFIIDLDTRAITDCNSYAARLVGRTKEELVGMHHSKLHPAERAGPCRNNEKIHSKDGSVMNYEAELVHGDGHRIPVLINAAILDIDGKRSMIGSYLDITGRKQAEEAMRDSEEKFRALADSSNIGILLIQGADIIYVNRALADMFGYTIDECMNLKYWDTALPEMKEHIRMRAILRQRGEPGPSRNELKMVRKNGEFIWLDCTAAMLQVKGKPAMMLTAMDITGRKMMEQGLRKSEEKYRSLVENSPVLVWDIDANYRCTYLSPMIKKVLGYEPEEALGKTPFDFIAPDDLKRVQELVKPHLEGHKPFEIEAYRVVRKDGSIILFRTVAIPLSDENGKFKGYCGVNRRIEEKGK